MSYRICMAGVPVKDDMQILEVPPNPTFMTMVEYGGMPTMVFAADTTTEKRVEWRVRWVAFGEELPDECHPAHILGSHRIGGTWWFLFNQGVQIDVDGEEWVPF